MNRCFLLLLAAVATAASAQSLPPPPANDAPAVVPAATAVPDAAFAACLTRLQPVAAAQGVDRSTFERITAPLQPDRSVLPLLDAQPEFTTPLWDYLAALVDTQRVADGQAMRAANAEVVARAASRYGVDADTIVAVWGVESDYGRVFGKRPLLVSLATLSCEGRRQPFFQGEFITTLRLIQAGDLSPDNLVGSWAGAFGHTQFMPSTYQRIAVDFDGDGRRDLVGSVADALGSTANYLAKAGWRTGEPWGHEVQVPPGFDAALAGRTSRRPLSDWMARGIVRTDGGAMDARADGTGTLPGNTPAAVLLPTGTGGPAFLVFKNYDAIYSYNAAESYALAIALLSDRLRGGGPLVAPWPTDDPGIGRGERRELQALLAARGHDIGAPDGMVGTATRRAIVVEQQRLQMLPADGRAGRKILDALKAEAGGAAAMPAAPSPGASLRP